MSLLDANVHNPQEGGPSFSLRHRTLRLIWGIAWILLARWTPVPFHGWRRWLCRRFGARIDRTAKIYPSVRIWYPPNLRMDAFACLAPRVDCYCMAPVSLGPYSLVSQDAVVCAGTHDVDSPAFQLVTKPIVIGKGAWIAARAFVGPGVVVGEGAVLGANAVAFRNLEPNTIYVGNPARAIRHRRVGVGN
jgi:putative colanic acid biosynthesis acetyltransferase WcaF